MYLFQKAILSQITLSIWPDRVSLQLPFFSLSYCSYPSSVHGSSSETVAESCTCQLNEWLVSVSSSSVLFQYFFGGDPVLQFKV